MSEVMPASSKTPGIVIFVAILNFISVAFFLFLSAIALVALIFGNVMGIYDAVSKQMAQFSATPNFSYGVTLIFGAALVVCLALMVYFLFIGLGLLRAKRTAWYLQIAMSILGLLGFPIGTVLNALILVFFFQAPVRDHFKV